MLFWKRGGCQILCACALPVIVFAVAHGALADDGLRDAYDPPPTYYNAARPGGVWYTGATLKTALYNIIGPGHIVRSYDSARQSLQLLDLDPNNSANIILVYTGVSVPKTWDSGVTWNREHMWPDSRDPSGACDSDLFNLRPCNPAINNSRGNMPYGLGSGYWDPNHGAPHRGDAARGLFYMAACYTELTLVNGQPTGYQMGDLAKLLAWHYEYPVTEGERRRNHLIYSQADNPSYYQNNRNPFIDYPELVWTIWGTGPNDAELYFGATAPGDGTSTTTVDLGAVICNAVLPAAQAVTLNKIGTNPTTFNIADGGEADSASIGPRQAFVGGVGARSISVGLSSSTAAPGLKTGTLTVDNTELTSAGSGRGSADGDDTVNVQLQVLEHANASFAASPDQNTLTITFGTVPAGSGLHTANVAIYNLETVPGFTAGLDLDTVTPDGDANVLYSDLSPFADLAAAASATFNATFDAGGGPGTYATTYTLAVSDENLSGAQPGTNLVLTLTGTVASAELADFADCLAGPGAEPSPTPPGTAATCLQAFDFDADDDVDLSDFAEFQAAFAG